MTRYEVAGASHYLPMIYSTRYTCLIFIATLVIAPTLAAAASAMTESSIEQGYRAMQEVLSNS